jgi:hypothetical protein
MCTRDFWELYEHLPAHVQRQADNGYKLFQNNPYHPGLHFKCINQQEAIYSVRVGNSYRVLGVKEKDTIIWYWIGNHEEYNNLV